MEIIANKEYIIFIYLFPKHSNFFIFYFLFRKKKKRVTRTALVNHLQCAFSLFLKGEANELLFITQDIMPINQKKKKKIYDMRDKQRSLGFKNNKYYAKLDSTIFGCN